MEAGKTKDRAAQFLAGQGIPVYRLLSECTHPEDFGNEEVIFDCGALRLRVTRERAQEFLEVGPIASAEYFDFDDVELAFGRTTVERILSKTEPEPLATIVARLANQWSDLAAAFASPRTEDTLGRLRSASAERGDAFVERLRRAADDARKA